MLKPLDFPRENWRIFDMQVNSFAMAKTRFFSKTLKTQARFSPRRDIYESHHMPGLPSFSVKVSSMVRQHPKRDPFSLLWSLGPACVLSMRKWGAKCWRGGRWAIHDVGGVMWRWRWCMVCTCKPFMIYETPWKSLRSNSVCHEKVLSWMYSFGFWFSASERTLRRSGRRQGITTSRFFGEWCGMPKCFQLFYLFNVKVFAPLYPCCA